MSSLKRPSRTADPTRNTAAVGLDTGTIAAAERADPNKPLTEKQMTFVRFWAQGDSVAGASRKAGYHDDGSLAYRMCRMPHILKVYDAEKVKWEESAAMDRKQVMDGFKEAIEMAKLMAEPANMIAGWREIGKMCGYYAPVESRVKIDVAGNITMQTLTSMTDAQLLEMIEKGSPSASPQLLTDETLLGEPDE